MAAVLSAASRQKLASCHHELVRLVEALVEDGIPLHVICGHRGKAEQDKAFAEGKSQLPWPESGHNVLPSVAVDLVPNPLDWNDIPAFKRLGVAVKEMAKKLGIELIWGGDYVSWKDYPHWELRFARRAKPKSP